MLLKKLNHIFVLIYISQHLLWNLSVQQFLKSYVTWEDSVLVSYQLPQLS